MNRQRLITEMIIVSVIIVCMIATILHATKLQEDNQRLKQNQTALAIGFKDGRTIEGASIAQTNILRLTKEELKDLYKKQTKDLQEMNVRLKDLQNYSQMAQKAQYSIETKAKDSIIIYKEKIDSVKCIDYANNYIKINACINNRDSIKGNIETFDTLTQTISIERKKFLWWEYGCKGIKQTVKSANPYARISAAQYIKIE